MSRRSALPLFPDGLSDESAAVLSEFLNQLAVACESRYFVQLRRYHQRQMNLYDPEAPGGPRRCRLGSAFIPRCRRDRCSRRSVG
jgi:hypothetical protein